MRLLDLSPLAVGASGESRFPGVSSWSGNGWVHGTEALMTCRVDPQSTCFDIWEELGLEKLALGRGMRHRADLAVAQLKGSPAGSGDAPWCVAVPAGWTKDQLQVFLGVARECGLSVRALFPRALAVAACVASAPETLTVLEVRWRSMMRVRMTRDHGEWRMTGCERIPEGGVLDLFRRESRVVAARALETHRIDPLHSGKTEQQLFDGWWNWHVGNANWVFGSGNAVIDFSDHLEELREGHRDWMRRHGLEESAGWVVPRGLEHVLGLTGAVKEPDDLSPALAGLDFPDGEGARWKESLRELNSRPADPPRATHVVIDGIAEPTTLDAAPGETVTLPDGRTGLAVHVPR